MNTFKLILFIASFGTPLFFQILFGSSIIRVSKKLKFEGICVISVLLLVITFFTYFEVLSYNMTKSGNHEGLAFIGLMMIEAIVAVVLLIIIIVQILVKRFWKRK